MAPPAGGGAYFFAKRSINADKQARHEADMKRRRINQSISESTVPPPVSKQRPRKVDHASSPSTDASHNPAPTDHLADNPETKPEAQNPEGVKHSLHKVDQLQNTRIPTHCKEWLLKNTAPSVNKTRAFGKYLVALSGSLPPTFGTGHGANQTKQKQVSSRRRRLHILYLLHDLVHHVKFHGTRLADGSGVIRTLEPYITQLVELAAAFDPSKYYRHLANLNALLDTWDRSDYFPSSVLAVLRDNVENAFHRSTSNGYNAKSSATTIDTAGIRIGENQKDVPYIMPASHGDASVPFYDLPAGNLMPCIVPNSIIPINPQMVKPLQFRAGPPDEQLARAVENFLQDIDDLYGSNSPGQGYDERGIDELGQQATLDDSPGNPSASEGYYGWSKAFCEKMRLKSSGKQQVGSPPRHETSQHFRKGFRKRRRRSSTISGPTQDQGADLDEGKVMSISPPNQAAPSQRDNRFEENALHLLAREPIPHVAPSPPVFLQQHLFKSGQLPVPPPPPPNYTGPWPPPPPPPPPSMSTPLFTSQKPAQMPQIPALPQVPGHVANSSAAQTFYGDASVKFPGQNYQGSIDFLTGQSRPRQLEVRDVTGRVKKSKDTYYYLRAETKDLTDDSSVVGMQVTLR
ncbi:MAG: hypothetical protein Q9169_003052 [Polycauliona sp. 2 TL-2023]